MKFPILLLPFFHPVHPAYWDAPHCWLSTWWSWLSLVCLLLGWVSHLFWLPCIHPHFVSLLSVSTPWAPLWEFLSFSDTDWVVVHQSAMSSPSQGNHKKAYLLYLPFLWIISLFSFSFNQQVPFQAFQWIALCLHLPDLQPITSSTCRISESILFIADSILPNTLPECLPVIWPQFTPLRLLQFHMCPDWLALPNHCCWGPTMTLACHYSYPEGLG